MDELFDSEPPALDTENQRLTTSRRLEILASLRQEREKRRALASHGQKYIIDHTDLTPVQPAPPLRSETINKLLAERRVQETSGRGQMSAGALMESPVEIGTEGDVWSMEPVEAGDRESPRQSDRQPDYRPLADIYESYKNIPESIPVSSSNRPKSASARTSSAPPRRSKTKEDLVKEAEEKLRAECTFKPKITPIPQGKAYGYGTKTSVEDKFDRLSRPKTDTIQRRERLKRETEEKLLAECAFKPKINQSARSSAVDVSERLYREAENRIADREQLKRMIDEEQVSLYAFQPQVQGSTTVLVGKMAEKPPIYKRVNEVQRERQETLQRLRVASERNDPDLTFKPAINVRSARLAEQKLITSGEAHLSISEKLAKDAQEKLTRQLQRAEDQSDLVRYSFEPQLSISSQDLPRGSFLERQRLNAEKQKARREEIRAKAGAAEQCTFKPVVDRTSSIIVESMPERSNETEADRLKRLYTGETAFKGKGKAKAEQAIYSEVTFEPQINPISKTLGRSASLSELAYNASKAQEKKQQAEQRVAERERDCTFQPQLYRSDLFGHVESAYGQSKDVMRKIHEEEHTKKLKVEEMKKLQEFEELKSCTFQPETLEPRLDTEGAVSDVKGLDRFLQLKDLARRQEEERKAREEQVFKLNPRGHVAEVPYTIPQPFNLHPSTKQQKMERAQREAMGREKAQCTFQPQTMELRNRQMIQKLLANEAE